MPFKKIFPFIFIAFAGLCACASAAPKEETENLKLFTVQNVYNRSFGDAKTLSRLPVHLDGNMIMLGDNFIMQLTETPEEHLALFLSVINPKHSESILVFDAPSRINVAAVAEDGKQTLLKFRRTWPQNNTGESSRFDKGQILLRPVELEPGQAVSGILLLDNVKAPMYKITMVNQYETFEFTLTRA